MNSMMDPKPRSLHISSSGLRLAAIALLAASSVVGQRVYPSNQSNTNNGKRNHIATIHSADSSEGSRVSISSDQALTDYEAYRRGDRFYVRIPASDVPRAEAVRGRGFADVTAQRNGASTTLAFRLQPGSTAHVQQSGNRLDVVIAVAGNNSPSASSRPRNFQWSDTSGGVRSAGANANSREPARGGNASDVNANKRSNQASNKNSAARDDSGANSNNKSKSGNTNSASASTKPGNSNSSNKPANANQSTGSNNAGNANSSIGSNSGNLNSSTASAANTTSPAASPSAANPQANSTASSQGQQASTGNNSGSPSPAAGLTGPRPDLWARAKERGHYWLLMAQLNPFPVAIGAAILVLIIALLLMQRRRARSTRRVKTVTKSTSRVPEAASQSAEVAAPLAAAAVAATPQTSNVQAEDLTETTRLAAMPPPLATNENGRKERVSRTAEEANKVFAGEPYDEAIVGSEDRETRRMVGAELLSAMVGRNSERRERARAAFMKHGYFDDATRDLRVASSDNERAAAARRLSFVQDREATPHLVGALGDPSPDVRRAAVEALMDQRDPTAIAPLNNLLQNETDRKVPRHLIEQAIEACATKPTDVSAPAAVPSAPPPPIDTDREVIEI